MNLNINMLYFLLGCLFEITFEIPTNIYKNKLRKKAKYNCNNCNIYDCQFKKCENKLKKEYI